MKRLFVLFLAAFIFALPCFAQQGSVNQYIADGAPEGETRDPYTVNSVESTAPDRALSVGTGLDADVTAAIIIGAVAVLITVAVIVTALILKRRDESV